MSWNNTIYKETVGKTVRKLRLVYALVIIVMILYLALSPQSEYKQWLIQDDVPVHLDKTELGFSDAASVHASVYSYTCNSERIGTYTLCTVHENQKGIRIHMIHLYEKTEVSDAFQHLVEQGFTNGQKTFIPAKRSYMPTVKYERAVKMMEQLEAASWNSEEAYVLNSDSKRIIFLKRIQEIVMLELNGIHLSDDLQEKLLYQMSRIVIQDNPE